MEKKPEGDPPPAGDKDKKADQAPPPPAGDKKLVDPPPAGDKKPDDVVTEEMKAKLARLDELEAKEKEAEKAKLTEQQRLDREKAELNEQRFRLDLREAKVPVELGNFLATPDKHGAKVAGDFSKALDKYTKAEVERVLKERGIGTPRGPGAPPPKDHKQGETDNGSGAGKLRSIMDRSTTGSTARK